MVLISLKSTVGAPSNNDGFLYETTASTKVDDLIESLVQIHNERMRCCLIIDSVNGLAMHGIMKRPENTGTDEVRCEIAFIDIVSGLCHNNTIFISV